MQSYNELAKRRTDAAIDAAAGAPREQTERMWWQEEEEKRNEAAKKKDQKSYWQDTIDRIFGTPRK